MNMDRDILTALDSMLAAKQRDKLFLLTPLEKWYPRLIQRVSIPIIVISADYSCASGDSPILRKDDYDIHLPCSVTGLEDLYNLAIALAFTERAISVGDDVVFLGATIHENVHFILVTQIMESSFSELHKSITDPAMPNPEIVKAVLNLSLEIGHARTRPSGALYVIGDTEHVLKYCTPLFMNPFEGQPEEKRNVKDKWLRDTLKEYARLDGAVIIDNEGVVQAAGVHINADARNVDLLIEGTRHATAMAITHQTNALAVTVSEKAGTIMVFKSGKRLLKVRP